jgi:hypothetical protein
MRMKQSNYTRKRKNQNNNSVSEKGRSANNEVAQKQKDATIGEIPYAATIIRDAPDN